MKIELHSRLMVDLKNRGCSRTEQGHSLLSNSYSSPNMDQVALNPSYQAYQFKTGTGAEMQAEIERLTQLLKQDPSFNTSCRNYMGHPIGRQLASTIIMADEDIQAQIAKTLWDATAQSNVISRKNPAAYGPESYLPPDYRGFDIKAMLQSSDPQTVNQVLIYYENVLSKKAQVSGLTETERLLSLHLERLELSAQGTFHDRMESVLTNIEKGFNDLGIPFDKSKLYSFTLDTTTFKFSASGGTDRENALIEQIINTSNYKENNLGAALAALYAHRYDDGSYNPWAVDSLPYKDEVVPKYGIASVPHEYAEKMKQLFPAYQRYSMDKSLNAQYGFGIDDIKYCGGEIIGKTEEITKIIKDAGINFMKTTGDAFISLQSRYKGTPEFSDAVFTLEKGRFNVNY